LRNWAEPQTAQQDINSIINSLPRIFIAQ